MIRKQTLDTARLYGMTDRGTLEPGMLGDDLVHEARRRVVDSLGCMVKGIQKGVGCAKQNVDSASYTKTRADAVVILGVQRRFRDQHRLVALLVVVSGLQQRGALATVHGSVTEIELAQG